MYNRPIETKELPKSACIAMIHVYTWHVVMRQSKHKLKELSHG